MRFVRIQSCRADMTLARPIYGPYGVLMLSEGNSLSSRVIYALEKLGYPGLYIDDEFSRDVELEEAVDESTRRSAMTLLRDMFSKAAMAKADTNRKMFGQISNVLEDMIEHIFSTDTTVFNVPLLKSFDDYTYQHSVDVGVLCIALGKALNMKKAEVLDLGKAAFFHDIGKMMIPKAILNKPGKLTRVEMAVMRKHTELGFDFSKEVLQQPSYINRSVLSHHERFDGTGYPLKLVGNQIPLFAQIIAMADVYDAIGASRVYKKAQVASESYEYILGNSGYHFNPELVDVFAKTIAPFPIGLTVILSNGMHAVVVRNNSNFMMRPVLRVFDPNNPGDYDYINLANDPDALNITIVGTV